MKFEGNKVNETNVDEAIKDRKFTLLPDGRTTICTLWLDNGFTVRGESSCVDPANYNKEIGELLAFNKARDAVWPFLGFRLADQLTHDRSVDKEDFKD